LVVSCSDDPEPDVNDDEDSELSCLPKAATKLDGKVFDYTYNGDDRLTKIELRDGSTISERYTVEYEGEVVKNVLFDDVVNQEPGQRYQINYDGTGKPTEVLIFNSHTDTDVVPNKRIEFTHNDAGRIATKKYFTDGVWMHTVRYEYTSASNVQKLFITTPSKAEYLASEFPSYDDKKRFYSASHELTLIEVYLFDYEPSVNNALKHIIYANVASTFTPAKELDYTMTYENNYVTSLKNGTTSANNTILFQSMTYQCE
jgi:YD repeat-containing protein